MRWRMVYRRIVDVWFVYLVRCRDRSLYCGIAKDVARRIAQHDAGKGARYTRGRGPVRLVWMERHVSQSAALVREAAVKRLPLPQKRALVRAALPLATRKTTARRRARAAPRSP